MPHKTLIALFSYSGVDEHTHEALLREVLHCAKKGVNINYARISGDALIERSRSRAIGQFLKSDNDVMVMIDHDISWSPGDACEVARIAYENNALVGGLYCKRAFGQGWASRINFVGGVEFGKQDDNLVECDGLATGFMAIPRKIAEDMRDKLNIDGDHMKQLLADANGDVNKIVNLLDVSVGYIKDGAYKVANFEYYDFFRCFRRRCNTPHPQYEFLSEDWAFSIRANFLGYKTYVATRCLLTHHGDHGYTLGDGMDDDDKGITNGKNEDPNPNKG